MSTQDKTVQTIDPDRAVLRIEELVENIAGSGNRLVLPVRFRPSSKLYVCDRYLFSFRDERSGKLPLIQGDINKFFENSSEGTYRMGWWGHGINSYALFIQLRTKWASLFLRMPFGGYYQDDVAGLARINEYLKTLSEILDMCEKRGVHLEVCESMGYGFYRLFSRQGEGIEFEESLFDISDMTLRFNKMLSMFAVQISRDDDMKIFFNDDLGYRSWLAENPDGFVLQARKKAGKEKPTIHVSNCASINNERENFTHGVYQKICAPQLSQLTEWVEAADGRDPNQHSVCIG